MIYSFISQELHFYGDLSSLKLSCQLRFHSFNCSRRELLVWYDVLLIVICCVCFVTKELLVNCQV